MTEVQVNEKIRQPVIFKIVVPGVFKIMVNAVKGHIAAYADRHNDDKRQQ